MIAVPVTPTMLEATSVSLTFICSRAFCMCCTQRAAQRTSVCRCRQSARSASTESGGRNEGRGRPQVCSRWSHGPSSTSVLGRAPQWRACEGSMRQTSKPRASSSSKSGTQ